MFNWFYFFISLLLINYQILLGQTTEPCTKIESVCQTEISTLEVLSDQFDGFLLDAYGVFWGSSEVGVLPGAAEAMAYLVSKGKYVGILSNSTQPALKEEAKLKKHGLNKGVHYHFILTSGEVAKDLLIEGELPFSTPRNTYWLFGSIHPRFGSHHQLFENTKYQEVQNFDDADFIYISIPHIDGIDQEDPEVFRGSVRQVQKQLPVLCVNPDRVAMEGSPPRPVVRQGSIAKMFVEENFPVCLIGKPSKIIFDAALEKFPDSIEKSKIVMIGDTPETDIRGAHAAGLKASLVTKTGVLTHHVEAKGIVEVINELDSTDKPDYLIDALHLAN